MKSLFCAVPFFILSCLFLNSCETTSSGYGYYLGELNNDTIVEFFQLNDEAASRQDFEFYKSFFSPNFVSVDRTDNARMTTYGQNYLAMVEELFETAESVHLQTLVMDIEYSESGYSALVKVHEEEKVHQFGVTKHYTSLLDVEIEIEEGWIFVNKATRTSMQVIED